MTGIYNKYIFDLPIIPSVVSQIISIPNDSNISSKELENIIKVDPYLTSRLLKISNSSFYARQKEITTVKDSVTLIGIKKVKTICLLIASSELITNKKEIFYKEYWESSINTAFIAMSIACETGKEVIADDIFTAGILHNIGQAILYNYSNDKYNIVIKKHQNQDRKLQDIEIEEFGINNNAVGSGVLEYWNFPQLIIDCVKNNLNISSHSQFQNILDIVSFAKLLNTKIVKNKMNSKLDNLFLVYQSRLNLRKSQIDYYLNEYSNNIELTPFYKVCCDTVFN